MGERIVIKIEKNDDTCIVRIIGRVTTGADDDYLQTIAREIKETNCPNVLIDTRELHSVGSSGIGFLVGLYTSMKRKALGRMVIAGPSPRVQEVLDLTRVSTIIPIAPSLEAATAFLSHNGKSAGGSS